MSNQERNHLLTGVLQWTEGNYCLVEKEVAEESQTQLIRTALVMAHTRSQMAAEEWAIRAALPPIPDQERVPDPPQNIGSDSEVFERAKGEQRQDPLLVEIIQYLVDGSLPEDWVKAWLLVEQSKHFLLFNEVLYYDYREKSDDVGPEYDLRPMRIAVPEHLESKFCMRRMERICQDILGLVRCTRSWG